MHANLPKVLLVKKTALKTIKRYSHPKDIAIPSSRLLD